ncbi:MAG: DUF4333 domain-containing protein [Marmoricola sp.]
MIRRLSAVAIAAGLALAATGCTSSLSTTQLEKGIKTELTKTVGQAPDKVTCPDKLKGKVGAKVRCTLTAGTTKYGVTVTATDVDGSKIKYSIKVDDKPLP